MLESLFSPSSPTLKAFYDEIQGGFGARQDLKKDFLAGMDSWRQLLDGVYDKSHLDDSFFLRHAFLVLVAGVCLARVGRSIDPEKNAPARRFENCFQWLEHLPESRDSVASALKVIELPKHDMFNKVYPLVVSYPTQHGAGEYYTPVALARMMVAERFEPGMRAVDPSCGSGTFIGEMVAAVLASGLAPQDKSRAIDNIAGLDKNPIAVYMATVNLILALRDADVAGAFPNLYISDALFPASTATELEGIDLVIGNPPWIVLGGIEDAFYKERLKQLAVNLGIYVGGKNASNLEIAVLFFYKFLGTVRPGKWIFFLLPNSIITGSQHDKARVFTGFDTIHAWRFSSQPFKIHSTCLAGRKSTGGTSFNYKFSFTTIEVSDGDDGEPRFSKGRSEVYEPGSIEHRGGGSAVYSVGRLIPADKKKHLLPRGKSPYARLFFKGAQIFPRTMFFVDVKREYQAGGETCASIVPSSLVQAKKLGRWNFLPYQESRVEVRYIFKVVKSTFIVPFRVVQPLDAFLPCERVAGGTRLDLVEDERLLPGAAKHMSLLQAAFASNLKPGAAHTSLREIINYQNCLVNPRQMASLKVAYNGGGSIVKGVLIEGDGIVDYSMFYCPVGNRAEGYYLCGYLNAPSVTASVKLVGSTGFHGSLRNIVKHPLDFPWPLFDPREPDHVEVARLGKELDEATRAIMVKNRSTCIGGDNDDTTRMKLQNAIFGDERVQAGLDAIDEVVRRVIENGEIEKGGRPP